MSYTTSAKVRVLLPGLLTDDDDLGSISSGTGITLTYPAYAVPSITIDGVASTAYTFLRPDKITLSSAATGQRFIATVDKGLNDTDLDSLIVSSDRVLDAAFANFDMPSSGYLEDWSGLLTAARYLRLYATGTGENIGKAESMEQIVVEAINSFKKDSSNETENIIVKVNR